MRYNGGMEIEPSLFIGREEELDALRRALEGRVRVVTIVGPLGAGKTSLANAMCMLLLESSCFFDLTDVFDHDGLIRAIARRLDVSVSKGDPVEQVADALEASGHDAVVLDNVEQIIGPARALVARFLEREEMPQLIVTSREALGLPGEVRIALGPLSRDVAIELFEAKARRVVPTFRVSEDDRELVGEMLEALDNLPLVIELAAARVAILPPAQLLRRLTDRFRHIRETEPQRTPRQASLEGAIAWSWELLDDVERRALMRASVFRGGFSLEAAEAVLDVDDPIATMEALVEKSLLRRKYSSRDSMDVRLYHYQSVRSFAAARLAEGDAEEAVSAVRAHREHFAALAASAYELLRHGGSADEQAEAMARLDESHANLVAALDAAGGEHAADIGLALDALLESRGPMLLRRRVLESFQATGDAERLRLLGLAEVELAAGRTEAAGAWLRDVPQAREFYAARCTASRIARARGDVPGAVDAAEQAVELAPSPRDRAHALAILAAALASDLSKARARCDEALQLLSRYEDARLSVMVRNVAGGLAMVALDLDTAAAHFSRVLPVARKLGASRIEAAALSNLGLVAHYRGSLEVATDRFGQAAEAFRRIGLRAEAATAQANRAAALIELERYSEASEQLTVALETLGGQGDSVEGVALATRGNLHHVRGELFAARSDYAAALARLTQRSPHAASTTIYDAIAALEAGDAVDDLPEDPRPTWTIAAAFIEGWRRGDLMEAKALLDDRRAGIGTFVEAGFDALLEGTAHPWTFVRLLRRLPRAQPASAPPPKRSAADLVLDENGYWFEVEGERVDIRRRGPARLLLTAMVEQTLDEPGVPFDLDALFDIGWPGQSIDIESAHKRVYAAIGTLRRLGLEDVIVTTDEGYLIDPGVRCIIA